MSGRLLWVLCGIVVIFFGAFRLADLEARVSALTATVERLERDSSVERLVGLPARTGSGAADGGGGAGQLVAQRVPVPVEMARLRREVDGLRALVSAGPVPDRRIIDVVEKKRDAVIARHLEFHRERWLEGRSEALTVFGKIANLSESQQGKLDGLLTDEVDRILDLLRDAELRDNPERLVEAWDETLNDTDLEVRRVLVPFQRERWEEARAFERAKFFPWLPK